MLRTTICLAVLALIACADTVSPIAAVPSADANQTANAFVPSPTPPNAVNTCGAERIVGLPANISMPNELCLDRRLPIDRSEDYTARAPLPSNALEQEYDLPFTSLPDEVQKVIRLTGGEQISEQKFAHYVILSGDESQTQKRSVKTHRYVAFVENSPSWDFKRQNKFLKLDSAELKSPTPVAEQPAAATFTLMCSKNRLYTLPNNANAPKLPLDLCFDEKVSVDKNELYKISSKTPKDSILKEEENISFKRLPNEVQNIIRLTSDERHSSRKFYLTVLLDRAEGSARTTGTATKDYLYYLNRESGKDESWTFKRQDNRLKLTQAELLNR